MSRSNPENEVRNPSRYFFEFDAINGGFRYWDKEAKKTVPVPYPFRFYVLDTLVTLKGYNEPEKKGYWSNEVKSKDLSKAKFVVKSKQGGVEMIGSYKECKEKMEPKGLGYVQSVYIMYKDKDGPCIANVQIKGSAIKPWIEFTKKHNIYKVAVDVSSHTEEKKGAVKYLAPVFRPIEKVNEESTIKANELDAELQEYLKVYFEIKDGSNEQTLEQTVEAANKPVNDAASDAVKPKAAVTSEPPVVYNDVVEDDSDLPF